MHFFFGLGNGDSLAFFHFPDAAPAAPGIAAPSDMSSTPSLASAIGSMNHIAFNVPEELTEDYRKSFRAKNIRLTPITNHDESAERFSAGRHHGVFMRSMYFFDPDGILLEFACWCNEARARADNQRPVVEAE